MGREGTTGDYRHDGGAGNLGSLKDPTETILEKALLHEKVEMQNYRALMDAQSNPTVRKVFQDLYREDLEQARLFGEIA